MTSNSLTKADVITRAETLDFPSSVVEFFQGYLGQPFGGFPEPLRSRIIRDKTRIDGRPGALWEPLDFKKIKADLRSRFGKHITDSDVISYVMYPKVFRPGLPNRRYSHRKRSSQNTSPLLKNMVISGGSSIRIFLACFTEVL